MFQFKTFPHYCIKRSSCHSRRRPIHCRRLRCDCCCFTSSTTHMPRLIYAGRSGVPSTARFLFYFLYVTSVIIKYYVTPDHADAPSFFMLWHFSTVAWCLAGVNQSGASNCQLCSATVRLFCPTPPRITYKTNIPPQSIYIEYIMFLPAPAFVLCLFVYTDMGTYTRCDATHAVDLCLNIGRENFLSRWAIW